MALTKITGEGVGTLSSSGATTATFNRTTSDGTIIDLRKDGTTVGSIGYESVGFYIDGEANHSGLIFQNPNITPRYNGSLTDDFVHLGSTTRRFKDLYLSGGVYLGGTGSANKLDDYEEGTWTPAVNNGGVTFGTIQRAIYVKVGKLVFAQAYISISASGTASPFKIEGLPFSTNTNGYATGSVDFGRGGVKGQYARTASSSDQLTFIHPSENVSTNRVDINGNQVDTYVIFGITYETTS